MEKKEVASFQGNDNTFLVSGSSGDTELQITGERSGSTLVSGDVGDAIVIQYSENKCLPYILKAYTNDTITVYPAIDDDLTDGILAPLLNDSQHLSLYGYRAYMQHVNNANPKYCEKSKYVAKYFPNTSTVSSPFSSLGMSKSSWTYTRNDNNNINRQYGNTGTIIYPYADYTNGKYGASWTVNTQNYAGYLETFIGTRGDSSYIEKDSDYPMYIDVYADGELIFQKVKTTNIIERVCVDYTKEQHNITLQVYYANMRKNNASDSIFIGDTTFWVNESYPDEILPAGATISEFFDSWGGFHSTSNITETATPWHSGATWPQGESGKELQRIMTEKSGFVTPVFNTSRGSMTSRWGKAWFNVAVKEKNPNVVLTEFGINDYHTTMSGQWPNIVDPYGNTIVMKNNPLTFLEYADNMKMIFKMAIMSQIQPVFIEPNAGANLRWTLGLINSVAESVV